MKYFRLSIEVARRRIMCLAGSGRDEVRAAKLFAGIEGKTLLAASERAAAASSDIHIGDADRRLRKSTGDTPYRFFVSW